MWYVELGIKFIDQSFSNQIIYFSVFLQLQTLKKNLDLNKDTEDDETILHNTYDPAHGSPRFTKNRRREREVSEKTNTIHNASDEEPTSTNGKKKSRRKLPPLKTAVKDDEENDKRAEADIKTETHGGRGRKARKGKSSAASDVTAQKGETETEDDYLQEYQHQILKAEEKDAGTKKLTERREEPLLNNELEKKKRKKKLKSIKHEGDTR